MMARRDKDMQVNLEPIVHQTVCDLVKRIGESQSSYLRKLVIADLRERGVLTDAMLADLVAAR